MSKHGLFLLTPAVVLSMTITTACTTDEVEDDLDFRGGPRTYSSAVLAIGEGNELCGYDVHGQRTCLSKDQSQPVFSATPSRGDDDLVLCASVGGNLQNCGTPPVAVFECNRSGTHCGCEDDWVDCVNLLLACDDHGTCDPYACPDGGDYACCCTIGTE